jgi:hypothetical protein
MQQDGYESYWYDKENDDQTSNYYIGTVASTLNTMSYKNTDIGYKIMSPAPVASTWAPTWVTTAGYVYIIVESYYYGMIPYSCYTSSSYPESIISV